MPSVASSSSPSYSQSCRAALVGEYSVILTVPRLNNIPNAAVLQRLHEHLRHLTPDHSLLLSRSAHLLQRIMRYPTISLILATAATVAPSLAYVIPAARPYMSMLTRFHTQPICSSSLGGQLRPVRPRPRLRAPRSQSRCAGAARHVLPIPIRAREALPLNTQGATQLAPSRGNT